MKKEIRIGLTVLSALVIFYLSLTWLSRTQLFAPEERHYYINFDNVNGLLEGDPVLIRGYTSGRVLGISPQPNSIKVEIALDSKIQLYENAQAEIQVKELMGGKQIAIESGKLGNILEEGADIPGKIALDFSSSFSQFGEIASGIDAKRIARLMEGMDSLMKGMHAAIQQFSPQRIDKAFSQTEQVLARLNSTLLSLNTHLDGEKIQSLLSKTDKGLEKGNLLLENTDKLMTRLEEKSLGKIEESLKDLPEIMEELNKGLNNLNQLSSQLNNSQTLAGRIFSDETLSRNLDTTLYNLNKTLEVIHSKRVIVGMKRKKKDK